jgi:hypothetical protein
MRPARTSRRLTVSFSGASGGLGTVWVGGDSGDMHVPGRDLHDEQHIQALQKDRGAPRRVWRLLHLGCAIAARKRRIAPGSLGSDTGRFQIRRHHGLQACRDGSSAAVERTVSVTAPTGPVRGYFCSRPWPPKPAAHGRIADGGGRGRSLERRMRWSTAYGSCEGERSVKPSAQPTLVRTQHLPRKSPGQSR